MCVLEALSYSAVFSPEDFNCKFVTVKIIRACFFSDESKTFSLLINKMSEGSMQTWLVSTPQHLFSESLNQIVFSVQELVDKSTFIPTLHSRDQSPLQSFGPGEKKNPRHRTLKAGGQRKPVIRPPLFVSSEADKTHQRLANGANQSADARLKEKTVRRIMIKALWCFGLVQSLF